MNKSQANFSLPPPPSSPRLSARREEEGEDGCSSPRPPSPSSLSEGCGGLPISPTFPEDTPRSGPSTIPPPLPAALHLKRGVGVPARGCLFQMFPPNRDVCRRKGLSPWPWPSIPLSPPRGDEPAWPEPRTVTPLLLPLLPCPASNHGRECLCEVLVKHTAVP